MTLGVAIAALFVGFALIAPAVLHDVVIAVFSPLLLLRLALALLLVSGVRRIVLGPARKQKLRAGILLVTYILAALPFGIAFLSLGALVVLALTFQWQPRFDLVQSMLLLLVIFFVFSLAVKTVLNLQLLVRHWFGR